jgi:fructose/tagatose bisphosphate aldolase
LGRAIAAHAKVPCGVIFTECSSDTWVERAITAGFNLVMSADSKAAPGKYTTRVKRLTTLAHALGVAIEAEVEDLSTDASGTGSRAAAKFVEVTGVDLLAVSVGNEEIKLEGRNPLDLARLEAIHKLVDVPLVLHGGSGIEDESLTTAIQLGVTKVNYGTYMKQKYLVALDAALSHSECNPHALLGGGSDTDLIVVGRRVIRDAVLERIDLLGCCGKA